MPTDDLGRPADEQRPAPLGGPGTVGDQPNTAVPDEDPLDDPDGPEMYEQLEKVYAEAPKGAVIVVRNEKQRMLVEHMDAKDTKLHKDENGQVGVRVVEKDAPPLWRMPK